MYEQQQSYQYVDTFRHISAILKLTDSQASAVISLIGLYHNVDLHSLGLATDNSLSFVDMTTGQKISLKKI